MGDESFICAGGVAGKDTCKGDGGSPLVCASKEDPFTFVQAGVVAWGIGCGENTLNHYSQCSISWTLSNFGRETDSLTSSGGYSDPHPGPPGGRTPPVTPSPLSDGSASDGYPENSSHLEQSPLGASALNSQV